MEFFDWLKNGRGDRFWTLTLTSDDLESHIVVND